MNINISDTMNALVNDLNRQRDQKLSDQVAESFSRENQKREQQGQLRSAWNDLTEELNNRLKN